MGFISKIETLGLVDGPGIRTVIFLNGCKLRCKYCHNPESWSVNGKEVDAKHLASLIINNKPYFKNGGGVTFSGGEPLIQNQFLLEVMPLLQKENINIALDTAGVGNGNYEKILKYVDLILFDVKHTTPLGYKDLTSYDIDESLKFLSVANKMNKKVIVRQVIIPLVNDNEEYLKSLAIFIKKHIKNVLKIEFLPYHKMGDTKYEELKINNPYKDKEAMDSTKCEELYKKFMTYYS